MMIQRTVKETLFGIDCKEIHELKKKSLLYYIKNYLFELNESLCVYFNDN